MYSPSIGLEIHVELKTKRKMFSSSANTYGQVTNTYASIVDLGFPGVLPTINSKAVHYALQASLAFNCNINKEMHFDRKNYFYPDLPKGYQITQDKTPIGYDGFIEISNKKINIERIHMEEDTAKSIHENNKTYINYNRAGIPLIEIVTKPDIKTSTEAKEFLDTLRESLLYLGVSDVMMNEGSMRCDVNISLSKDDTLGTKIEIKNLNSINSVKESIEYEIVRQTKLLDNNETLVEETRKYDESTKSTQLMRIKETGNDYRYFIEPDLPTITLEDDYINEVLNNLPILPNKIRENYKNLGLSEFNINILISNINLLNYFNELLSIGVDPVIMSNVLTKDILGYLNKSKKNVEDLNIEKEQLVNLINLVKDSKISNKLMKEILIKSLDNNQSIDKLIDESINSEISDESSIIEMIDNILDNNLESVEDYKLGKDRAIKFLMGQLMKESKGQVNPVIANKLLVSQLSKR